MKYASAASVTQELERSISACTACAALLGAGWCAAVRVALGASACAAAFAAALCIPVSARAGEVEVLHFWTSPGEAQSVAEIKALMAERGHTWKDFAVVGGGGQNAMAALRQRVLSGQPPASASIKGPAVQEWAAMNVLANLDTMAAFDHWDKVLPQVVKSHVKHNGH